MSTTLKVNVGFVASMVSVLISVGGVLIGAGYLVANQNMNSRDIQQNLERIHRVDAKIDANFSTLSQQMREDKHVLLTAIRGEN